MTNGIVAFNNIASFYDKFLQQYPQELLSLLKGYITQQTETKIAIDVGAGTGISMIHSHETLNEQWQVIGLEPNDDMLRAAQEHIRPNITF